MTLTPFDTPTQRKTDRGGLTHVYTLVRCGMKQKRDKRLDVARMMPPLKKREAGSAYDAANDETLRWIAGKPEMLMYLFDLCGRIGYVTYDPKTGEWRGADT